MINLQFRCKYIPIEICIKVIGLNFSLVNYLLFQKAERLVLFSSAVGILLLAADAVGDFLLSFSLPEVSFGTYMLGGLLLISLVGKHMGLHHYYQLVVLSTYQLSLLKKNNYRGLQLQKLQTLP